MKKWGGLMYLLFLILDIIPNIFSFLSGRYGLLEPKIPWLIFIWSNVKADMDNNLIVKIPWLSSYVSPNIPFIWLPIVENIVYYVFLSLLGIGIWQLWQSRKLIE